MNVETPDNDSSYPKTVRSTTLAGVWTVLFLGLIIFELVMAPRSPVFWVYWELGTLITATIYTIVFYVRLFYRGLHKGIEGPQMGNVILLLFTAVGLMLGATIVTLLTSVNWAPEAKTFLTEHNPAVITLSFLCLAFVCFCAIDITFQSHHTSSDVQDEFARGLYFNGIPVFVAFLVLLIFAVQFPETPQNADQLKSFIGGAVAFEILTGNTVFVILFWRPRGV